MPMRRKGRQPDTATPSYRPIFRASSGRASAFDAAFDGFAVLEVRGNPEEHCD
jgi:hypothetical protein